jgi:AAA+ superfamily predicted ATPase
MTNQELAKAIRHGLFADRETLKDAFDYAFRVINACSESERLAVTTAMFVVLNTVAKEIEKSASDTIFSHIDVKSA